MKKESDYPHTTQQIRVMATGVFDLLHPGHIYFLEESRKLGDELVVLVTNDVVVQRTKPDPLFDATSRQAMVAALRCVDRVVIPSETDPSRYYQTVLDIAPDIITLGYDQSFSETTLQKELAGHGWHGKIVRIAKSPVGEISSTKLKESIRSKRGL